MAEEETQEPTEDQEQAVPAEEIPDAEAPPVEDLPQEEQVESPAPPADTGDPVVSVADAETFRAEFEQLPVLDLGELEKFVNRYDDVPMKVSIELGRVTKSLQDIIEWKEGSIVETKKLSGMPMEIMVNDSLFGHGEVVVVGDNLAIRITELAKPNLE
ncbi:TPA: hypothetical protein DCE37_20215 [Candidatus Latescibacteria bacterium]|nr:hypothetical protein [Candidatus Latescibacterota bacterium]